MKLIHKMPTSTVPCGSVLVERTMPMRDGTLREEVFSNDGPGPRYLGTVVYVRRGKTWGWRPEQQTRAAVTSKSDAIARLPRIVAEAPRPVTVP